MSKLKDSAYSFDDDDLPKEQVKFVSSFKDLPVRGPEIDDLFY